MEDLTNMNFTLGFNNFNPEEIQTEETINAVFVVDVSPSIKNYENELNDAFNAMIDEFQNSHISDRLLISTVEFDDNVHVKTGFQPVANIPHSNFVAQGYGTALYDAVEISLKNAIEYREALEDSGVICKTLVFILTDGMDNSSADGAADRVKQNILNFLTNEKNIFTFESILFGIGKKNEQYYDEAKVDMGIKNLVTIDTGKSPKETAEAIRKMINFISSSISASSSGQALPTVNF